MSYQNLLLNFHWRNKRQEIFYRDNWRCQYSGCNNEHRTFQEHFYVKDGQNFKGYKVLPSGKKQILNVHHKVYRKNMLPWEQPDEDYITLCEDCHQKWHDENEIVIIDQYGYQLKNHINCNRCGGEGYIIECQHIENGVCFKCNGLGIIPRYFRNIEFPEYKGNIDYDLDPKEEEVNRIIDHISTDYRKNQLIELFNRLESVIIECKISNFDERFLISPYCPWQRYLADNPLIWIQIDIWPIIIYPSPDLLVNNYREILFTHKNKTDWIKNINKWLPISKDITQKQLSKYNCNVYSRDFRQLHLHPIYKAAIDHKFRQEIIHEIEMKTN